MTDIEQLLENIPQAPEGPAVLAMFDFDGTVIAGYTAMLFLKEQIRDRHFSADQLARLVKGMLSFAKGKTNFTSLMLEHARSMQSGSEQTYINFGEEIFEKQIARRIYPESRALVEAHLCRGHTVAIISSATPYQVMPAARELGIIHVKCSQMEVVDGRFTGEIIHPVCFGKGKVTAAESLAEQVGADINHSFFYSDSEDDLQLLERVEQPVALNPTPELQVIAQQQGWPIAKFDSRGRTGLGGYVRSLAAMTSVVGAAAAGLPILALTGSQRAAQNFSFSLFGDIASALVRLDLQVKGEHNLWVQRPAVFVFNHQSKADAIIISKLLRRDAATVGKSEIRDLPILGRIFEFSGMIFVDRANSTNVVKMMQPLVDAIQKDAKSVIIAPEGTRSTMVRLGEFKKGAFHIAMNAGVPVIPIVIHNSADIAPKGDFVFRPGTVRVDVLPPVDTSVWRADTMAEHVEEVRSMYLSTLGQADESTSLGESETKTTASARTTVTPALRKAAMSNESKRNANSAQKVGLSRDRTNKSRK